MAVNRLEFKFVCLDRELDQAIVKLRQKGEGRNDILRRLLGLPPRQKAKSGPKGPWKHKRGKKKK